MTAADSSANGGRNTRDQAPPAPEQEAFERGFAAGWAAALRSSTAPAQEVEYRQLKLPNPGPWGTRLERDEIAGMLDSGAIVDCDACGEQISSGGPVRIWVRDSGEIGKAFCGECVISYAKGKREAAEATE